MLFARSLRFFRLVVYLIWGGEGGVFVMSLSGSSGWLVVVSGGRSGALHSFFGCFVLLCWSVFRKKSLVWMS